jgi:hypothetical protein
MSGFVETDLRSKLDTIPRSMIHSLIGQGVKSVVVQGPYASSFAMNAAYTVAKEYLEKDSIEGFSPVTYLVRRSIDFPLVCKEVWNHDESYKSRTKVVDLELADENWDEQVLKLINIVHIRSIKDLLSFLLSLHSHHKRPRGALIVDNIELFTMQTSENSTFTNEDTQNIIQICKNNTASLILMFPFFSITLIFASSGYPRGQWGNSEKTGISLSSSFGNN